MEMLWWEGNLMNSSNPRIQPKQCFLLLEWDGKARDALCKQGHILCRLHVSHAGHHCLLLFQVGRKIGKTLPPSCATCCGTEENGSRRLLVVSMLWGERLQCRLGGKSAMALFWHIRKWLSGVAHGRLRFFEALKLTRSFNFLVCGSVSAEDPVPLWRTWGAWSLQNSVHSG